MKKIFISLLAVAALAACTKSEIAYEAPAEIGFTAVAGNITKAAVDGNVYPTDLNMYVNAYVHASTVPSTPDYILNGEFVHRTTKVEGKEVWGGVTSYYWPNNQTLHFSGFSKSGSFYSLNTAPATTGNGLTAVYNPSDDLLTINNYSPGTESASGANDLMWFRSTKYTASNGYDKSTKSVPVEMYHTCSWITFMVQGDAATSASASEYKVTSLKINGIDLTADVKCYGAVNGKTFSKETLSDFVKWENNTAQTGEYQVNVVSSGVALVGTYTSDTSKTPKNLETGETTNVGGNVVVIPQEPGTIDIAWTYKSSTGATVSDSATGLSLKLDNNNTLNWVPGKHYVYTITIKANEILIAPTPVDWVDDVDHPVTIE